MAYSNEVLADSPIVYYRCGEAVGTGTMTDSSTNALNGTWDATNPPTLATRGLLNMDANTCGNFNGTSQFGSRVDNALLDLTSNFTAEAWVTCASVSAGEHRWAGKGTVGANGYSMGRSAANPSFFNMGVAAYTFSTVTLKVGVTYHMVFHFDSTFDVRLFLNGYDMGQVLGSTAITAGAAALFLGKSDTGTEWWDGKIDEVALYSGLLSSTRVQAHYAAGIAMPRPDVRTLQIGLSKMAALRSPVWAPYPQPLVEVTSVGGTTFPQSMDGTAVLVTAAMQRQVNKGMTGTAVAVTGTMARLVGKAMTATSVLVTAARQLRVNKNLTATTVAVTAALTAVKVKLLAMTATTVVVTASMLKQVNKNLTGTTVLVTGSMVKQVNKLLTATTVLVTATLATVKVKLLAMTATAVVVTASLRNQVNKLLTATSVVVTASRQLQVNKAVRATNVVVTASMTQLKVILFAMTATTVVVTATMRRQVGKVLAPTVAVTGTIVKSITHRLTATVFALGSLVASFSGPIVGPFKALLSLFDAGTTDVTVSDTVSSAVSVSDATGADVTVTSTQAAEVTTQDVTGADVTITEPDQ